MGVVWRAWLFFAPKGLRGGKAPRPLALKVLQTRPGAEDTLRALFMTEAEALRNLQHANIVRFHEFFEWSGSLVLAMELVDGGTLADLISRHRARARIRGPGSSAGIAVLRAWYYFQQLLGALAATHAIGNRATGDVKPSNVLIRKDGIVKLGDYGIARFLPGAAIPKAPPQVTTSMAVGSGAYMSPEQVLSRPVDARSDLYSAAIVLYEMLAGRPPSRRTRNEFTSARPRSRSPLPRSAPSRRTSRAASSRCWPAPSRRTRSTASGRPSRWARPCASRSGQRDTAEWRAQREIASQAPMPQGEAAKSVRAEKLQQLHEAVVRGYRATSPTR